jgi:RNA polymerase sigma factor (sigma-70 family)
MATSPISVVLQRLRTAFGQDEAGMTDGELLTLFLTSRDEAPLAVLARRHAPMVWGVCRRLLRSHHDAEDAFQATFLVLVRKADSVKPREAVGNWLYGVAYQTAVRVRAMAAKRGVRERQVADMPEPVVQEARSDDLLSLLDQELRRLPDKYRLVIVLGDLEGKTRTELARKLGVSEGTVAGRLARAREMLAKRLARRGLAISGGGLASALAQSAASASAPAPLVASTIQAASLFAAGQAAAAGLLSAKVVALTEGVLKTMLLTKLKTVTAVLLVLGMVGFGGGLYLQQMAAARQGSSEKPPAVTEKGDRGLADLVAGDAKDDIGNVWQAPREGLIINRDASLYYIKYGGRTVVVYLPGEWGASSRSSSDALTKTFITDVTLQAKGKQDVLMKGGSDKPNQLVINGTSFDLTVGSVLRVDAGGRVFQLPFQPLTPTQEYLQSLKKYIGDGK